jgi:rSAM/selenodomain-associated transferase 1
MPSIEPVAIAILAKAPTPGLAKTRLIPALGREGAALLQARLIARALATACAASTGPVTLWAAPEPADFGELVQKFPIEVTRQADGDLGARMHAAFAARCPAIVIGSDCPALTPEHLRSAADDLRNGTAALVIPAEDGGYVLIALRRPEPGLFADMPWGTAKVMEETRRRAAALGIALHEQAALWDVDLPEDLERMREAGLGELVPPTCAAGEVAGGRPAGGLDDRGPARR